MTESNQLDYKNISTMDVADIIELSKAVHSECCGVDCDTKTKSIDIFHIDAFYTDDLEYHNRRIYDLVTVCEKCYDHYESIKSDKIKQSNLLQMTIKALKQYALYKEFG